MLSLSLALRFAIALLVVAFVASALHLQLKKKRLGLPLPPGPPGEPILGHLRIIPEDHPEYQYTEWGKQYSERHLAHLNIS